MLLNFSKLSLWQTSVSLFLKSMASCSSISMTASSSRVSQRTRSAFLATWRRMAVLCERREMRLEWCVIRRSFRSKFFRHSPEPVSWCLQSSMAGHRSRMASSGFSRRLTSPYPNRDSVSDHSVSRCIRYQPDATPFGWPRCYHSHSSRTQEDCLKMVYWNGRDWV